MQRASAALVGGIYWLPPAEEVPRDRLVNPGSFGKGFGHPVVLVAYDANTEEATILILTSFGGNGLWSARGRKAGFYRLHVPIEPAPSCIDDVPTLHLTEGKLASNTWINIEKPLRLNFSVLRPYGDGGKHLRLSRNSYKRLGRYCREQYEHLAASTNLASAWFFQPSQYKSLACASPISPTRRLSQSNIEMPVNDNMSAASLLEAGEYMLPTRKPSSNLIYGQTRSVQDGISNATPQAENRSEIIEPFWTLPFHDDEATTSRTERTPLLSNLRHRSRGSHLGCWAIFFGVAGLCCLLALAWYLASKAVEL